MGLNYYNFEPVLSDTRWTMTDRTKLDAYIAELEGAAYQRGRDDAKAAFLEQMKMVQEKFEGILTQLSRAMGKGTLKRGEQILDAREIVRDAPYVMRDPREPREGSDQLKVLEKIREHPGLRGVEVVKALEGSVEERTVRTALHRLKRRNAILQKENAWYPVPTRLFE
jgi:hypothetical protein